jgi:hypothetical protein
LNSYGLHNLNGLEMVNEVKRWIGS